MSEFKITANIITDESNELKLNGEELQAAVLDFLKRLEYTNQIDMIRRVTTSKVDAEDAR